MIDSQISFPHEAAGTDLLRRTFKQFFSLMHYDDMVGQTQDQLDVMLDEKDGDAASQRFYQSIDIRGFGRRHALRRLVKHQELGPKRHAEGNLDPPLIAVREITYKLIRVFLQFEFFNDIG